MYRHKLRLVSYIIHNEKLSNSPLLIARARLQVLLGSVNTSIKLNSFTPMSLVYAMRNVASPVFTRSHSKSVKFIQANISLWFTHNGCYPRRRWDEELCTESMPDASMELRHWDHLYYCPRHLFTGATSGIVQPVPNPRICFILMQSVCCRCAFIQFPLDREMYHSWSAVTSCCHFPSRVKAGVHQNCGGHTKLLLPLRANQQRRAGSSLSQDGPSTSGAKRRVTPILGDLCLQKAQHCSRM